MTQAVVAVADFVAKFANVGRFSKCFDPGFDCQYIPYYRYFAVSVSEVSEPVGPCLNIRLNELH